MKFSIRSTPVQCVRVAISSGASLAVAMVLSGVAVHAQIHIPVTLDLPAPSFTDFGETLHMEGSRFITGRHRIRVYDVGAVGPPTLTGEFGVPPDDIYSWGFTVAINGDLAVVADPGDDDEGIGGGAFVYERDCGTGIWSFAQNMEELSNQFVYGRAAVFHGDQVLVSEPGIGPGHVHVYNRVGVSWVKSTVQPVIIPHNGWTNGNNGSQFGHAMAVSGDTLIVTQPFNGLNGANVYEWNNALQQWVFDVELGFNGVGDNVGTLGGTEIDFDGNIVVFASPYEPHSTGVGGAGAAYIFEHDGTQWTGPVRIEAPDPAPGANFAYGVAVNAATGRIAIGSPHWKVDDFTPRIGAGYIFHKNLAGNWLMEERLEPVNIAPGRQFGQVVQMNEDVAIFGTRALGYSIHTLARNNAFAASSSPSRCNGDGGDQLGCVDCPCGNNAAPGTRGGCLNAPGESAKLTAERSLSVSNDSLQIKLEGAGVGAFAVLTSGSTVPVTSGCGPNSGRSVTTFTDGLRCVGGGMRRHGGARTGLNGKLINPWSHLASNFGYVAGQMRIFQAIYRDGPATTCGTNLNSSNALEIVFTP